MTRGDFIGILLLLVLGVAGSLGVMALRNRQAPVEEAPHDAVGGLTFEPSRRIAAPGPRALEEQTQGDPRWSRKNSEAILALEAGELERAVALFEECLAGEPDEPIFRANLAEALARLADARHEWRETRAAAIELLARAVELAPDRRELRERLEQWRKVAAAEDGFWTDESPHFSLSYDGERTELLNRGHYLLLNELEAAYQDFGELFGHFPVEEGRPRIQVVLYRRQEFADLTGIGHWAGGVFDGVVRIPVEDLDRERANLARVLRHELVHAFVYEVGGRSVPGWLNEGLAQWLEYSYLDERAERIDHARKELTPDGMFPLERLAGSLASWKEVDQIRRAYAQSLAVVGHIKSHYGERLLFELVEGCRAGRTCAETFRQRTGVELDTVVADLARSL